MLMRRWTPPTQVPITSLDNNNTITQNQGTRLRWCKVLVSASILIVIFGFCIVYTIQKQTFFNEEYQHKQQDNYEQQQRLLFDTYIDDISNILLKINEKNSSDDKYFHYIQTKTLILLRNLDVKRKKDILLFLYQRNLIQNNQLNLYGADLNNVELICPHDFHHLYLSGVHWSNAIFINCRLTSANFSQAYLLNARFINSTLDNALFIATNLDNSQFIQTIILNANFQQASLIQADFLQADIVQGNNFKNADLYQAKLTNEQLEGKKVSIIKHDFYHARYPNGSFELNNSNENLILNGNAEMGCPADNQTIWKIIDPTMTLSFENNENITNNDSRWGNCSFVLSNKIEVYQNIDLHSYSLLIDTDNAELSFSAFANCNQSYFQIRMYRSDEILYGLQEYSNYTNEMIDDGHKVMHQYGEYQCHLPIHTRRIEIYFGIKQSVIGMKCYFDNIILTIHQNQKK